MLSSYRFVLLCDRQCIINIFQVLSFFNDGGMRTMKVSLLFHTLAVTLNTF